MTILTELKEVFYEIRKEEEQGKGKELNLEGRNQVLRKTTAD